MNGRQLLAGLRRWAWAGAALWLLVTAGSVVGYARTPPVYIATQQLNVALMPIGPLTATNQQRLDAQSAGVASTIASGAFLASPAFTTAVSQQLASLNGANATNLSAAQVAGALTAIHEGTHVTLMARTTSTAQAARLAQAAAQALAQHAGTLLAVPSAATLRLIPDQAPPQSARDAAADAATRGLLLARLELALVTALLATLALAWIGNRASQR